MNLKFISIFSFLLNCSTINAQEGWFWQNPLPQGNILNSVDFIDQNTGWAIGQGGTILKTTNAGSTWITQSNGTINLLNSVSFADVNNGLIAGWGGMIIKTTNGGTTWFLQNSGTTYDLLVFAL